MIGRRLNQCRFGGSDNVEIDGYRQRLGQRRGSGKCNGAQMQVLLVVV